ncbi:MAG: rhomboid family intramembrane serine protease, partial [Bacteroidia bacterium]
MSLTLLIILATVGISLIAMNDANWKYKLIFSPTLIEENKQWYRFLTCGFIHADFLHLGVNMYVLYMFGEQVESFYKIEILHGGAKYLIMFLGTIMLANVRTFFKERHNHHYFSLGASGGVSGVVFSYMLLNPFAELGLLFIPFRIPAFIFGPRYKHYYQ